MTINLILGDCLERMKEIPDGSVDMILADPPYGTTACKWDSVIDLTLMWDQLKRIIKPNGAIVLTASQPFTSILISSNVKMWKHNWTWDKVKPSTGLNAKHSPLRVTEDICVFAASKPYYNPQMIVKPSRKEDKFDSNGETFGGGKVQRHHDNKGFGYPKNLLTISNADQRGRFHPTQKPVELMEYLIKTYSDESQNILDFTMGSGTTGVACIKTNRNFIGIEMDEKYFNIAKSRIQEAVHVKQMKSAL